jgi:O-antigen/teichoic acid export membrane protein
VTDTTPPRAGVEDALPAPASAGAATRHIRGSSMLLVGRTLAMGLDFGAQVLLVRYLSKADFGALSYALAIVALLQSFSMFEMSNTLSRLVPLYRARKQYGTMFGSILLAFGFVVGIGALLAVLVITGLEVFNIRPTDDPQALRLLVIVAALIPIQALDGLFTTLFAAFGSPRVIFLRQSIVGPGLRLAVIFGLILLQANVEFLVTGYIVTSIIGVSLYAGMFLQLLHQQGMLKGILRHSFSYPVREMLGFATPLLASTLIWILLESSDAVLIGYFHGTEAVASYRVVLPMARLNQFVLLTFATLYKPMAIQLHAQHQHEELSDLYWQTALWMTILTFPIFIFTFSFAESLTIGIYGSQYADSVTLMMLLSVGYFFHTILGFNGVSLKIFKKLRFIVTIDILAAILNIVLNLLLIPRWGPVGAAVGTAGTMFLHNLLKQFGLWRYMGISLFHRSYLLIYLAILVLPVGLLALQSILPATLWVALPVGGAASLLILWSSRGFLQVGSIFPELRRWPGARFLFGA